MKPCTVLITALLSVSASAPAFADTVDLTFEGINSPTNTNTTAAIENFYNGGTSSVGTSGVNYGISFPSNALAICLNTTSYVCSAASRGGLGDPNSQNTALFFLSGSDTYLDDPAGFTTGFSFYYTSINEGGAVGVYSGLDGTGTLLATLNLGVTPSGPCPGYNAPFCPFVASGVTFAGTAESIDFNGVANQIAFDDVTFGSSTPGPSSVTPEPSSITLCLTGMGLVGAEIRRRLSRVR
jgi:hypothetical protein